MQSKPVPQLVVKLRYFLQIPVLQPVNTIFNNTIPIEMYFRMLIRNCQARLKTLVDDHCDHN